MTATRVLVIHGVANHDEGEFLSKVFLPEAEAARPHAWELLGVARGPREVDPASHRPNGARGPQSLSWAPNAGVASSPRPLVRRSASCDVDWHLQISATCSTSRARP